MGSIKGRTVVGCPGTIATGWMEKGENCRRPDQGGMGATGMKVKGHRACAVGSLAGDEAAP